MGLSTGAPRPTIAYQSIADHWGITSFTVDTPQTGEDNSLSVTSESWTGAPGLNRGHITALTTTVFTAAEVPALLTVAGGIYEAARAQNVSAGDAMYLALKRTLEQALQQQGVFPGDAG